jgi:hypothetical protein
MASIITYRHKGDLKKTDTFLRKLLKQDLASILHRYGQLGVEALSKATPVDTGKTAASWGYTVEIGNGTAKLTWTNSNSNKGVPIALLIQYGHGTPTGGYVPGRNYIKPAIQPILDELTNALWKEVSEL